MPWKRARNERDLILIPAIAAAGGSTEAARKLGITKAAISQWRRVPRRWLKRFARMSGFTPSQLRPDLDGKE